jgi:hypothetical protein
MFNSIYIAAGQKPPFGCQKNFYLSCIKISPMKKTATSLIVCLLLCAQQVFPATYYLDVTVYGSPANSNELDATAYSINGNVIEYSGWTAQPSIHIVIIDSSTCSPLTNCNTFFGQANTFSDPDADCLYDPNTVVSNPARLRPESYFIFRAGDPVSVQSMVDLLDSVPPGNFILAYSWFPIPYSTMDASFRTAFNALGSTLVPAISDDLPFIFFCKKGDAGTVVESVGPASNSVITLNTSYQCSPTAVDNINMNSPLLIFPNPAENEMKIQLPGGAGTVLVTVYDATGKIAFESVASDDFATLNTRSFSSGFYFVRVKGTNYNATVKVCVMHD